MFIQSEFKDRYDYLCHQFRDEKVIYKRKRNKIFSQRHRNGTSNFASYRSLTKLFTYENIARGYDAGKYRFDIGVVAIGNKLYQYIKTDSPFKPTFTYGYDNVSKIYDERMEGASTLTTWKRKYMAGWKSVVKETDELNVVKDDTYIKKIRAITQAPIVRIEEDMVVENECLNDIQCPVDPYTIYMELMSFLQTDTPDTNPGDDYDALDAHGFDEHSFKREPGGPTRKRKKLNAN